MKKQLSILLIFTFIALLSGSCVSKKKLTYLQYSDKSGGYSASPEGVYQSVTPAAYKIMTNDILFIRVITPDPEWSRLFNVQTGEQGITMEAAALSGYTVDLEGYIEIPFVPKVKVAGKTLSEVKADLENILKDYVTEAAITVRLVENNITIIGEVTGPGRYPILKERLNIFEALAMAGDLSDYGNRQKIQVIRPSAYGPVVREFTLADRSILSSEYYYVMPNDIIYVKPLRARSFMTNSSVYTLFFTTITTALVVLSYFRTL